MSNHFTAPNNLQSDFLIPKSLVHDDQYKNLNSSAVILYAVLLDEMLSRATKNGWVDDTNSLYVIYPTQRMMEVLNISTSKLSKMKQQLIAHDLIEIKRGGIGAYDKIYVKKTEGSTDDDEK